MRIPRRVGKKGVNQFTDQTPEEFRHLLGVKKGLLHSSAPSLSSSPSPVSSLGDLPDSVDWRSKGVISAVKDQGQCGSCWTFGAAEGLESAWAISTGQLVDLSEQQILDCTPNPQHCGGSGGCEGGTVELAYQMVIQLGGISTEWTYPYISYKGTDFTCQFNGSNPSPFATMKSFVTLDPINQYDNVITALANVGPLVINVDASTWHSYDSGVFDGCDQQNPDINHVVQLVGYGTDAQQADYWLIRNSWAPTWGERGYIRLRRDTQSQRCGIDLHPQDGTGCDGGPANVTVCGTCGILYDVSYPVVGV